MGKEEERLLEENPVIYQRKVKKMEKVDKTQESKERYRELFDVYFNGLGSLFFDKWCPEEEYSDLILGHRKIGDFT